MNNPSSLALRLAGAPVALLPARALALLEGLREGVGAFGVDAEYPPRADKPYEIVSGVAVVPINGILLHGEACWWWGAASYGAIAACLTAAIADPEVNAIALHIDSPGGEVAGCFDLADNIFAMRGAKPIWAIVDEYSYSAAYALASAADRILVPRTGGVGSIGVITMHVDMTAALEQWGIKVTTIQFGARKSDSYPTTPLSDEARDRMQADIDKLGEMFVALVARNRGIDPAKVRGTEAGCFLGQAGVDARLADAVMSADDAFLALVRETTQK